MSGEFKSTKLWQRSFKMLCDLIILSLIEHLYILALNMTEIRWELSFFCLNSFHPKCFRKVPKRERESPTAPTHPTNARNIVRLLRSSIGTSSRNSHKKIGIYFIIDSLNRKSSSFMRNGLAERMRCLICLMRIWGLNIKPLAFFLLLDWAICKTPPTRNSTNGTAKLTLGFVLFKSKSVLI